MTAPMPRKGIRWPPSFSKFIIPGLTFVVGGFVVEGILLGLGRRTEATVWPGILAWLTVGGALIVFGFLRYLKRDRVQRE